MAGITTGPSNASSVARSGAAGESHLPPGPFLATETPDCHEPISAIYACVKFFDSALAKDQILYATVFLTCVVFISMVKTFAWQMMHRNSIKREIKRLAIRLAELTETVRSE